MSLRLRLTLTFTILLGTALLIFGVLVYALTGVIQTNQTDDQLRQAAIQIVEKLKINSSGQFDQRSLTNLQIQQNILYQVWSANRTLQIARPPDWRVALDDVGLNLGQMGYRSSNSNDQSLRVFTIPLKTARGPVGILQIGLHQNMLDLTQRTLGLVLILLALITIFIVGVATWVSTRQVLIPLETMTEVATRITRADDLSRRIPMAGASDNEIGQLIQAFNETLERLETLFTTQRRFMADVSHELRTPLTVIKGEVGLMRHVKEYDEESLVSIENEVDRLTRLVGDLLLLAQAESGKLPLALHPMDLDSLLMDVYQQARLLAGERLTVVISDIEPIQITGDRDRLKQVMLNLIGNAIQYTPNNGQVTISLHSTGDFARFTVSDTGIGIPPKDLPHIFERFYRAEKSRKRSAGTGFGLGLSIAFWIVKNHGGTIDVTSVEGKGTTFSVLLPVSGPSTVEKLPQ